MREIKFRAWDNEEHKMLYGDNICHISSHINMLADSVRFTSLQFTGLSDKNGKEIYEGDIVQVKTWTNKEGNLFKKGEVCYSEDHYFVAVYNDPMSPYSLKYPHPSQGISWEVIGNIYESPELSTLKN